MVSPAVKVWPLVKLPAVEPMSTIRSFSIATTASAQTAATVAASSTPTYEQRVRLAMEGIAHGDRAAAMASMRTAILLPIAAVEPRWTPR